MKNTVLFCTGLSGTGKSYFIKNILPQNCFYPLKSATTRAKRDGEMDGREYYFRDESYFDTEKLVTKLWVNEAFWQPGTPKWMYGVPEFEVLNNMNTNFVYDVIQPKYVRQMTDWFISHKLTDKYDFKILWFQPTMGRGNVVKGRQNMPNDLEVRRNNTCNMRDFANVGLFPDHRVISAPNELYIDDKLKQFLIDVQKIKNKIKLC